MKCTTFEIGDWTVFYYADEGTMEVLLRESRQRGAPLTGAYSVRKDQPHNPPPVGKYHLHVYQKNRELFAINFDGTAHDQSHGVQIPKKVADALRARFPKLEIPENNLIESDEGTFEFLLRIIE
jgi:hypothetical protein